MEIALAGPNERSIRRDDHQLSNRCPIGPIVSTLSWKGEWLDPMWERRRESMGQMPWWGGMAHARDRIVSLSRVVPDLEDRFHALQESETPAQDLLNDEVLAENLYDLISDPASGRANDQVCQWLYETYQTSDAEMQLVVLRYIPVLCGVYLPRVCGDSDEPLAGFEAVLLALYADEARARGGRPVVVNVPDLTQPSLYHTPRPGTRAPITLQPAGPLSSPLEPQGAVKSTKRASIVGVALELFSRRMANMPVKAKLDFCHVTWRWAVQGCSWSRSIDQIAQSALPPNPPAPPASVEGDKTRELGYALASGEPVAVSQVVFDLPSHERSAELGKAILQERVSTDGDSGSYHSARDSPGRDLPSPRDNGHGGAKPELAAEPLVGEEAPVIPLSQDLLRPILMVLGHCLMAATATPETKAAAAETARALYVRATHDLLPETVIAARSLLRLDAAASAAAAAASAQAMAQTTPSKRSKPEILLQAH